MANRLNRLITKRTAVPGRVPTGTTGNESNFIRQGELAQNTADKKLFGFDGVGIFEFGSSSFLSLTGGTISGDLYTSNFLTANTYYSGSTPLETIIANIASNNENRTFVQPGLNTYTGGTASLPTINISAATLSYLSATTLSGETIYSGNTEISSLFGSAAAVSTLQSQMLTKANRSGDTFTGNVNAPALSATTISGGTYYSGSTPLETIIANLAGGGGASTYVQPGLNTYTGGTASAPTVNISSATLSDLTVSGNTIIDTINASGSSNYFSQAVNGNSTTLFSEGVITIASDNSYVNITGDYLITNNFIANNNLSGGTIYSGNTEISSLFGSAAAVSTLQSQMLTKANRSGDTFTGQVNAPALSAATISGGTIYSGSTPLETIIANIASNNENTTYVQPGLNIYTGGTPNAPTVNVSAATLTYLSATTVSASTLYSGSTDVGSLFGSTAAVTTLQSQMLTKANRSGDTFTGTVNAPSLSANTLSGGTIYSGSTPLETIITNIASSLEQNDITRVQPGLNIYTGGTANAPTINISAATLTYLSATTISGGTYYSGSTPLETIITNIANALELNDITRVQPGLNTYTGGTANAPTVNISAATLTYLSATTISGGTIYSGSTPLTTIISNIANSVAGNFLPISGGTLTGALYTNAVYPSSSLTYNLGDASARWNSIYGTNLNILNSAGYEIYFNGGGSANIYQSEISANMYINTNSGSIYMGNTDGASTFGIVGSTLYSAGTALENIIYSIVTGNSTSTTGAFLNLSGGTVTGNTTFTSGLTINGSGITANISNAKLVISAVTSNQPALFFNQTSFDGTNFALLGSSTTDTYLNATSQVYFTRQGSLVGDYNNSRWNFNVNIQPNTNNAFDIGTPSLYWNNAYLRNLSGASAVVTGVTESGYFKVTTFNPTNPQIYADADTNTGIMFDGPDILSLHTGGAQRLLINAAGQITNGPQTVGSEWEVYFSGDSKFDNLSATTISASTYYSGNTEISSLFGSAAAVSTLQSQILTKANRSGDTFTGTVNAPGLSATTLSGGTIYSGSTPLETIIANMSTGGASTYVQPGLNTYTGGTANAPTVNISAATLSYLSATTISGGTIYSGNTEISSLFGSAAAVSILQSQMLTKANRSGDTFTGTVNAPSLSATTISGGTIYSGNTEISSLFGSTAAVTTLQSQILTKANRSGDTFTGQVNAPALSATTVSGGTIYSGSTDVGSLFGSAAAVSTLQAQIVIKANRSGDTFTGQVNATAISATTVSASTLYSGSTDVGSLFGSAAAVSTLQAQIVTKANLSGATFTGTVNASSLSATTLSGGTIYSGSTPLETIIANMSTGGASTYVQPGLNTYTGGTANAPTVNISAATLSYLSATTITASTIFINTGGKLKSTNSTGELQFDYGVNSSLFSNDNGALGKEFVYLSNEDGQFWAGTFRTNGASIIYGGSSTFWFNQQDNTYFVDRGQYQLRFGNNYSLDITTAHTISLASNSITVNPGVRNSAVIAASGITADTNYTLYTNNLKSSTLSATTLSGETIYSGSTPLETIIANMSVVGSATFVQPGTNTYTGGTPTRPTVNISAATLTSLSSTTISGETYFSGSTPLETIIANMSTGGASTYVQPGLNTYTGGTPSLPTINISAATLTSLSATTISGNTIYSGTTSVENIFLIKDGTQRITVGTTAPSSPSTGDLWIDTN